MKAPKQKLYARQAIITKYLGPTNSRGSRVKASCEAGSVTIDWNDALDSLENHAAAALALATKLQWTERNQFIPGGLSNGFVFVAVPKVRKVLTNNKGEERIVYFDQVKGDL